jgi:flagellar biosynthesis/type III secretory pathway M-ring protein FliF/YscJ
MTQERGGGGGGPGVVTNTSRTVAPTGVADRTEKSTNETTYDAKVDVTQTTTESPRHVLKSLSASVNIPRSYLAAIFKSSNKGKDPTDADIEMISAVEKKKIVPQVKGALGITDPASVVDVNWFHDDAMVQIAEAAAPIGSSDSLVTYAKTYGGKVGVGVLGVMGLLMMLMMVRRVREGPVLPGEEPPPPQPKMPRRRRAPEPPMTISAEPVGRAEVTEQLLMAKEVDEQTVRTQQVIEQVQGMIKEDADGAVGILQRWIDREKA